MPPETFHSIGQIIQLSVAPAFLLVAIASFINVATMRLGRVVDRARVLEGALEDAAPGAQTDRCERRYREELLILEKRMQRINISIVFTAISALLVCLVVALLFLSDLLVFNGSLAVALLFIATMVMMIIGLLFFLSEIIIARRSLHVHSEYLK